MAFSLWEDVCEQVIFYQHGAENCTEDKLNGEKKYFNAESLNVKFVLTEDAQS